VWSHEPAATKEEDKVVVERIVCRVAMEAMEGMLLLGMRGCWNKMAMYFEHLRARRIGFSTGS
jgi:hypothetical protein